MTDYTWLWGTKPSLATHFDTWQDAVRAVDSAPPATRDVHVDPTEDGRWLVSKASYLPFGPRAYLTPAEVMFPPLSPA